MSPGAEDPETIVLRQRRGLCRARQVDTSRPRSPAPATGSSRSARSSTPSRVLLDRDRDELATAYLPVARSLVREGFLEVADATPDQMVLRHREQGAGPTRYRIEHSRERGWALRGRRSGQVVSERRNPGGPPCCSLVDP